MSFVRRFRPALAVISMIVALFVTGFTATPVAAKTSATALTSNTNPSVAGQLVTFTATVTGAGGGTPSGTVTFRDSTAGVTLGNGTLNGSAVATLATSTLSVGSHVVYCRYSGDGSFPASSSPTLTQTINKASTTTTLALSPNPSAVGQSVTLTATLAAVAPGTGTPGGTVTFKDGATTLGSATLSAGIATFATSALSAGSHSLTAVYAGDASFATSTSGVQTQVVGWTITASAGANGAITPSGSSIVTNGGTKSFTITPNACYSIASVLVDGVSVGAVSSYTFTNVTAGHTISASFALNTYTIAASAGAGGSVSPAGNVSVNCGANQAFTITPNACYSIANVLVDGVSVGAVSSYTFSNVTAGHTIAASFTLNTYTIAASAGAGGAISAAGNVSVNCGAIQAFTITPNSCYSIANVLVDGVSVGAVASYTFTNVTAGHTIEASFTLNTYTIAASAGAGGAISPAGSVSVNCGTTRTFTITPDACYSIAGVLVDGVSVGAVSSYTFTNVTAAHTIAATFSLNAYAITASAGAGGGISPAGDVSVNCGANQAFTITPNACYSIASVSVDGVSVGTVSNFTFTNITAGHTIAASFTLDTHTIVASAASGGVISPAGDVAVECGADQVFTITPDGCHTLADVLVDGVSVGAVASYTFTNATAGHSIAASFTLNTDTIAASAGAGGAISPAGSVSVDCGTNHVFTLMPDPCYAITDVLVDGASVGAVTSYTFTNVTAAHTIAASFTLKTYAIVASAAAGGTISQNGSVSVDCGAEQAFTITPDDCHTIAGVLVDGVPVGAVASYTFSNVTAGHAIAASFAVKTYAIAASADAGGSISPNGSVSVDCGANQVFTITADGCHTLADVLVDGVSVGAVASHTFTDVTAGHTITASFTLNQHTIAASAGPDGAISPNGDVPVNCGADQVFTISPAAHFHVADVLVDGVSVGAVTSYTAANVTAAHTITATFATDTYAIVASAGANGSVSPAGTTPVPHGGELAYTITAAEHYHVADVLVDGASVGVATSFTFTNVTEAHTIAASFAIDTYTITASAGVNGSVSPAGATSVDYGADQVFVIMPAAHYHVADVLVDGASVGAVTSYTFTNVTGAHTIAASFAIDTYTITASAGANGAISPAGATSVDHGSELAYTITPAAHYHVADVLVDGASVGAVTSFTFTNVTGAHTIAASFAIDTYAITASAGANGAISPAGATSVDHGSELAYAITPAAHYHVADVLVDGMSVGAGTSFTFTNVTAAHTIAASFAIDTYTITASAGPNGSVSPAGAIAVDHAGEQTFTITANAHYHVADVLVDGASVGAVTSFTFSNVTTEHTIAASFAIDTYAITASAGANGSVSPAGASSVDHGSELAYTITPAAHYHVADVLVDGASVGAVTSFTFTNVTAAHTISASFAIDTYTITASAGPNGSVSPTGATSVDHGAELAYAITPAAHYHVADVLVDGASMGAVTNFTFTNVTGAHTIAAAFAIDTYAITASAGANGAISPAGATSVDHGSELACTITPNAHYHVADVLVDGASVGAVTSFTFTNVTGAHSIAASFAIDTYMITASAGQDGAISPVGATSVDHGSELAYAITPAAHYHVANVLVDGASVGAVTSFTFTNVTAAHTIAASFAIDTYAITASAGANGAISPAGAVAVDHAAEQTFTVTANAHYHVADVLVDGASVGAVTSFTFSNVTTEHTIAASFAIDTYAITASAGANGSVSPAGASSVDHGSELAYTITPAAHYHVADVLVDGASVGAVTSFTFTNVTAAHTISASFAIDTYTITASAGPNGSVSPTGATSVDHGAELAYAITPAAHYHVADVLVDGASMGAVTNFTFTNVTQAHTITASFAIDTYTITASADSNGAISPAGLTSVDHGSELAYTITPNAHYHVADVLVDGASVSAVTSFTFTNVTGAHTITASFAIDTYMITASAGANGVISPVGATSVDHGAELAYTITPAAHYHVANVLVDGASVGAVTSFTFTNVTAAHTIAASFAIDTYAITASAGANGAISPAGAVAVDHAAEQTFTITANAHYHVVDVLVDGASVGAVTSFTFANVTAAHTIAASFAIDSYAITASAGANGSVSPAGATSVDHGSELAYTFTPAAYYHVADVLVDGASVGPVTSFTFTNVTAAHTIAASFAIDTYAITASAGANGAISPVGATSVDHGSALAFTITPAEHYHVADVLVDGASVGAVTNFTFSSVAAGHTISATFAVDTYAITAGSGPNGSVSPAGATSVDHGAALAYTITPNAHYHVADVLVDGASIGAVTSFTFTNVTETHTIAASFAIDTYVITASAGSNGLVNPAGATSVDHGAELAFTITPAAHYHVADVRVDGASVGAVTSFTFSNVGAAHTIAASFAIDTYAITASAGSNGSVSPAGATSVEHGGELAYTITPADHYHIATVLVDGASVGAVTSFTFANVTAAHTIAASFAIDSYAITASAGANGSVSPAGATSVDHGADLAYTITPNAHYHVGDVLVDGISVGAVTGYTFSNVTGNHTIAAVFAIDTYTITASAGPNGTISPVGALTVDHGAGQTFMITPAAHYHVTNVLVDGASVGAVTSFTFSSVAAGHTISATFAVDTYAITAGSGPNGSVTPAGATSVDHGAALAYTITPNAHYHVADVLVDGASVGAVTSFTFTNVTGPHTIAASFAIDTYTITASADANGSVSPAGVNTVEHGAALAYTITPAAHYHVADVLVDGTSVGAVASFTFSNVAASHTISATFAIDTYMVTATAGANGSVSPAGASSVEHGGQLAYAITPSAHYHVADVLVDGTSVGAVTAYTFTNVTGPHTIAASFAIDTYTITASAGVNGSVSPAGATSVARGAELAFTITPDAHYHVADVRVDGASVGAVATFTFTNVTGPHTIAASFAIDTYTITASAGPNGSVSPAGATSVEHGGELAYTITPAAHYHIATVLVDGAPVGAVANFTFSSVAASHTISATFAIDAYTINATAGANGSVSPAGASSVEHGGEQAYTITPNAHYHVGDVLVDGASVGAVTAYTFTNVTGSHTIAASFAINTHTLTLTTVGSGTVSRNPELAVYEEMSTVTLTAHPEAGWTFAGWSGGAAGDSNAVVVVMDGDQTITATFRDVEAPVASLTAPNGGEVLSAGSVETIRWTATDNLAVSNIRLELSTDGGANWAPITDAVGNTGDFAWTVPSLPGTTARVRVTARDAAGNTASDASDADFEIQNTSELTPILAMRADSSNGTRCYPIPSAQGPWQDLSGRYHGELVNFAGTMASGWNGNDTPDAPERLEFTGSEAVMLPAGSVAELQSVAPVTAEMWFRTSHDQPATGRYECLLEWLQSSHHGMSIALTGGQLVVDLGGWVPMGAVQPDTWYHVAVAKDAARVRVYVNGVRVYTGNNPWNGAQLSPIGIGASVQALLPAPGDGSKGGLRTFSASPSQLSDFFTGAIAQVRVWQGAMNDAQVRGEFTADCVRYPLSQALPAPERVVSLDATQASGANAYSTPNITSPWVDLVAPATDANLIGFNGTSTSGWQGDGSANAPYRLKFDGLDDVVSIPAASIPELLQTHALSAEMWFQTPATMYGSQVRYLMQWLAGLGSNRGLSLAIQNSRLLLDVQNSGGQDLGALQPNTWYHVIVAKQPGEARVYLNGARIYTSGSVRFGVPYTAVTIGASTLRGNGVYAEFFNGSVGQVHLWRGAVSDSIAQTAFTAAAQVYLPTPASGSAALSVEPKPASLALAGMATNPVRGALAVRFSLPSSERADVEMLDISGRVVRSAEVGAFGPGQHTVTLGDAHEIPAGIYWVRLRQSGRTFTAKTAVIH